MEVVHSDPNIDVYTGRPRTPNEPYSVLTEDQIKRMSKDPSPFFMKEAGHGNIAPVKRSYVNRYSHSIPLNLTRNNVNMDQHCFVGEHVDPHNLPKAYDASMEGASEKWGPSKAGDLIGQFYEAEDRTRYTNIDMYRRNASNAPEEITMKYGRPNSGYYYPKFPNSTTWFNSNHVLNENKILTTIKPKTTEEYKQDQEAVENWTKTLQEKSNWSDITEYTSRFEGRERTLPNIYDTNHGKIYFS